MSFAEKMMGLMARPNQQQGNLEEQPFYIKYGIRILGMVAGFFCVLFGLLGVLNIITFDVGATVASIIQMVFGFVALVLEAPCCFFCIDFVGQAADMIEAKPLFYKAGLYMGIALIPIIIDFSITRLFICGLLFATGVGYGMIALGKKASSAEMRAAASTYGNTASTAQPTTNDRAGIVNNAQPFSFTGAVGTDSNV